MRLRGRLTVPRLSWLWWLPWGGEEGLVLNVRKWTTGQTKLLGNVIRNLLKVGLR